MSGISIANRLEVIGQDTIIVPGCEPQSALTSATLARFSTCKGATVKLMDAIAAVPGSTVEFQINNGESNGSRRKWFVFPPWDLVCPCEPMIDVFAILKSLAGREEPEETVYEECMVNDQGWCPPKDFKDIPPPPVSPYREEGSVFGATPALLNHPYYYPGWANSPGPEMSPGEAAEVAAVGPVIQ